MLSTTINRSARRALCALTLALALPLATTATAGAQRCTVCVQTIVNSTGTTADSPTSLRP